MQQLYDLRLLTRNIAAVFAVDRVTDHRVPYVSHVYPYLVGASGF
jgi:hypothetical protein